MGGGEVLDFGQEVGRRRADQVARKLLEALGCSGRGPGVSGHGTWTQPRGWGPPEPDSAPSDLRLLHSFKNLDLGYSSSEPQFPHLSHEDDVPPIL